MTTAPIEFPEKLQCLFSSKRYIVLYGGRGAGRSWGVARYLLLKGVSTPLTVLCARELQKSIDESVHKVLRTQIENDPPKGLGLREMYDVQRDHIYGPSRTEFSFIGVKNDPNKVRSYEDIDICWVEEGNKVSKASWQVLTPTIRKKGSQIIVTFNPELKTDYTYKTFVTDLLPKAKPVYGEDPESPLFQKILWHETEDTVICMMDYEDNPWFFSDTELAADMEKDKARDEDTWLNVWKGYPRENLDGAIYAKELRRAQIEGRICQVPDEREVPVDTFWDLGKRDQTCIWFIQRVAMQWRVLDYLAGTLQELSYYIKELQRKEYAYGNHFLPHDGAHSKLGMRHTILQQLLQAFPRRVHIVDKHRRSDGINATREVFPQLWFDAENTSEGVDGLRRYRYAIKDGQLSKDPLHDEASDVADALRTFAMSRRNPRESDAEIVIKKLRRPTVSEFAEGMARGLGWME